MQLSRKIFITGTNRGLGRELVKLLHKTHPELGVHISSRSPPSELAQQWQADVPHHSFTTYQIDLNNSQSIARSVQLIQESKVQFDFLVANAAVGYDEGDSIPSEELASSTLRTNVIATIDFVKQFLPLLAPQGRVLLISSFMGALSAQPTPIRQKLNDPSITEAEILSIAEDYIAAAAKKQMGGYHWSAYRTSKALLNAWGRFILPKYLKPGQTEICLHPGWCFTDMGGSSANLTPQEGAERIATGIWLKEVDHTRFFNEKFCDFDPCQ